MVRHLPPKYAFGVLIPGKWPQTRENEAKQDNLKSALNLDESSTTQQN
jgi:hypothetical protein